MSFWRNLLGVRENVRKSRHDDPQFQEIIDAAWLRDLERIKILLKANLDLVCRKQCETGFTLLHFAAKIGHQDLAELLLANKAQVNDRDFEGRTPLHIAAIFGRGGLAELLLANKAEVNAKANNGQTPLHSALMRGHKNVAELLLANRADVNARENNRLTLLDFAAANPANYREELVELIRRHGGR